MNASRTLLLISLPVVAVLLLWSLRDARDRDPGAKPLLPVVVGDAFPREVRMPDGTVLHLPAPPQRVVLANTSVFDMATALLDVERMAALPDQLLKWSAHGTDAARFAAVPRFTAFTVEEVVVHQPDLVVCGAFNLPETTAKLRALGVPLVVMPPADDVDGVVASLRLLGRLFGTDERAEAVCADLTRRAAALTADRRRASLRVLAYASAGGGAFTSGRGTLVDAAIGLAGMRNAAVELGFTGDHPITVEEILHLDPDVLLVGVDTGSEQNTSAAMLRTTPVLADLRAVRQQRIVSLHRSYASSASQELVTAAERLAAAVDAFASERGR